ncbi:hypothetical protein H8356DRAFT_950092 [Neocallimastix lanati (nom. inval.)]|nr:hypothetical protein H8356DRAFT_950092 [Neocallimastix sp. JGI-2020a]
MDKTDKNIKNQNSIRKTTRRGSLKSLVGSVEAKRSPILVEVSSARRQNARIKKTTKTPTPKAFYDLHTEKQTLDGYIECLRRCDTFPAEYKDTKLFKQTIYSVIFFIYLFIYLFF